MKNTEASNIPRSQINAEELKAYIESIMDRQPSEVRQTKFTSAELKTFIAFLLDSEERPHGNFRRTAAGKKINPKVLEMALKKAFDVIFTNSFLFI